MAPKRKYEDDEPQAIIHPSRQAQVPFNPPKGPKRPRKLGQTERKMQAHSSSVNAIKKRMRDVTRRLERSDDLPANIRVEDERALAAYSQELAAAEAEKLRQKTISKYHMVRFFERQKATRIIKKLRKQLLETESTDEVEALKIQLHIAEVDLNYTQYCPLNEIYVGLYSQKKEGEGEEEPHKEAPAAKPPMWAEVEKSMEEGTLDRLRNRVAEVAPTPARQLEIRPAKKKAQLDVDTTGMNRRERRAQLGIRGTKEVVKTKNRSTGFEKNQAFGAMEGVKNAGNAEAEGDDSDGGFFEE